MRRLARLLAAGLLAMALQSAHGNACADAWGESCASGTCSASAVRATSYDPNRCELLSLKCDRHNGSSNTIGDVVASLSVLFDAVNCDGAITVSSQCSNPLECGTSSL